MRAAIALSLCAALVTGAGSLDAQGKGKEKGKEKAESHQQHGAADKAKHDKLSDRGESRLDKNEDKLERRSEKREQKAEARRERAEERADRAEDRAEDRRESFGSVERIKIREDLRRGKNKYVREIAFAEMRPAVRAFAVSDKLRDRIAAGALSRAHARGVREGVIVATKKGDRLAIASGNLLLLELDDDRARDLGAWNVFPLHDDNVKSGAPAFCRSGEGHPVWGRQWCLDKGFGLGMNSNSRWGYTNYVGDLRFAKVSPGEVLAREALVAVLGQQAFDRLALHAITLGLSQPISGRWIGDGTGPRVLLVQSAAVPVAELVDLNGDNRADRMVVALRSW
jgi:hypothetical protein